MRAFQKPHTTTMRARYQPRQIIVRRSVSIALLLLFTTGVLEEATSLALEPAIFVFELQVQAATTCS